MPDQPSVVDQYDIGDETPEVTPSSEPVSADPPAEPAKKIPPQDPVTKKFITREEAVARGIPIPGDTQKHPSVLAKTAKDLGFDQAEIDATPTPELRELVRDAVTARSLMQRETIIDHAMDPNRRQDQPAPSRPEPAPPAPPPTDDFKIDNEDEWHPALVSLLKAQHKELLELKEWKKGMEEKVGHLQGFAASQIHKSTTRKVDRAFASLDKSFEPLLGKGTRRELGDNSAELSRRKFIVQEAERLAGPKATQDQVIAKIGEAAQTIFGVKPAETSKPEVRTNATVGQIAAETEWRNGGLAMPTHRMGATEPAGPKKAEKAVGAYLQDNGLGDGELDEL